MPTSPGRDEDADTATATAVIQERPKRKWQSYIWDSLDKTPEERKFLFKLDSALVTFACLGYFIKYLDQANINNAFVSGMKEDLGLYQNQLNYLQVAWTVGYVVSQVPSNILLTRVRPSLLIPTLELVWSILTISISRCQDVKPIYVLRFFIGFAEGGLFPGLMFILGSWYRKDELAKRACIFHTSGAVATMISGYLMAAVYRLGGRGGYAGWQWLFIIDAVISLPVALAGYFVIPDVPEICRAFYFRKEEIAFAQKRMELEGRKPRAKFTKKKIRKILTSWHIYLLALLYVTFNNGAGGAAPIFAQYLKDSKNPKYTVTQINTYPTTTYAVQIVTTLTYAWLSDSVLNGARWPPIVFGGIINIICYVSLAVWDLPNGWRWTCYIISGAGYGLSGLCMT
ncbi:MAG: hypothetical protein M1821_004011 [Bathelium mastoideum]|nr:MAG: hypothetical protein M1821_004011 [Bathelium mastoideum]